MDCLICLENSCTIYDIGCVCGCEYIPIDFPGNVEDLSIVYRLGSVAKKIELDSNGIPVYKLPLNREIYFKIIRNDDLVLRSEEGTEYFRLRRIIGECGSAKPLVANLAIIQN